MKPATVLLTCAALAAPAAQSQTTQPWNAPVPGQAGQEALVHEVPAVLQASSLLPAEVLRGPSYRVREQVPTDGFMAHFTIDTDFGVVNAVGVPQAKARIFETEAIRKLVETSKSDLFAEGMKRSLEKPIDAVKNIAQDPVESVKAVPKTVGHFFKKVGSSIERGANKISESHKSGNDPSASEVGKGIGETAKNVAGFESAKLATARELNVDPYTDNERLKEEINKVTWAFFAGGLPLRIGAAAVSAGVALTATNMIGVPEDVYALTESELALRDKTALLAMGLAEPDVDAFQIAPALSITQRHRIVGSLQALPHAGGRGNVVVLATRCTQSLQVDILAQSLRMLAERQQAGTADYTDLKVLGRLPGAITATGEMEVPAPTDYVTWTEDVAAAAQRDDLGVGPKVLVHTGKMSPAATTGFTEAGWKLIAIPYPGS